TCGHTTNLCHLDTTHHHPAAAVMADIVDTVVVEVGTAGSTDHTEVEHKQVGCRLPAVEHCTPEPCARTLPGTCPNDMNVCTPSSLSSPSVSPYDPSYHINLA
ncbi:hypothetical protein Tco_0224275, partial [Tanacetum coccineum]